MRWAACPKRRWIGRGRPGSGATLLLSTSPTPSRKCARPAHNSTNARSHTEANANELISSLIELSIIEHRAPLSSLSHAATTSTHRIIYGHLSLQIYYTSAVSSHTVSHTPSFLRRSISYHHQISDIRSEIRSDHHQSQNFLLGRSGSSSSFMLSKYASDLRYGGLSQVASPYSYSSNLERSSSSW
jgi:hypothetical protein